MRYITIAGQVTAAVVGSTNDGKQYRKITVEFPQYGDKLNGQVTATTWGKKVEEPLEIGAYVIITGELETFERDTEHGFKERGVSINSASIMPGAEGLTLNVVNIAGRVGGDPDVKFFESGATKCRFTEAVNKNQKTTFWFNIELWGKTAEVAANYVRKGSQVGIIGELTQEFWVDKQTQQPRSSFTIKGKEIGGLHLLGSKRDAEEREPVAAGADIDF